MEGISDEVLEVARNLFDGGDIDYNIDRYGKATVNTEELPDLDNYEYTYGTTRAEILQQAIDLIVKILPNVTFYNDYNDTGIYLELSDNHTFWDINEPEGFDGEFDYDLYNFFVEQAFDEFENQTGVELYQCGRSGRHICVEVNFDNILNYDNLCKTQAELEQQVIGEAESNCFGQALEEAKELAPDEKVAKCLSCGMKIKYKNRDVQHDAMGDYLECPNCHSTFDVDYDNIASIINEGLSQKAKEELIQNAVIPEIVDILIDGSRHGKSLDDKKVDYVTSDRVLSANEFDKIVTTAKELISSNKQLTRSELYSKVASVLNNSKKTEAKSDAEIVNETSKYLADNGVYAEVDIVDGDIILNIPWGDWKHDHQRADYLMKQKGYVLEREEVTEEDGSDTYSAMRYYVPIGKGIKVEATDSADDIYNKLPNTLKNYLKNTDNVPTKEIDGTLWFNVTAEEKEQLENFVQAVDTIPESAWRNWDEKTKLDISSYANNANRICKNCVLVKEGKALKIEAEDYSVFKPAGKVLSGNKGLSEKEIDEIRGSLPDLFKDMTDEQKQIWKELSLRGMVMSCLIYGEDIHTSTNINAVSKYYKQPYVNEYYDTLGKDVTEEIIKQQTDYFNRGKVIKDVGTDSDGLSYNSFVEPKDESKKVTEAEDMTQVKDDIETAVEKSDSTDLEKDQVKGSIDVLKTDEESAIEGYEDFKDETDKVADKELADAVNNQMEEIIDDEKEHIEKLDTIKSALGENKKTEAEVKRNNSNKRLDYKLDGFKGVNIIVVDKKNNIDTEDYIEFDSMEFGIDEYEFEDSMIDGIKDILTDIYEYTDDYYDDRFTKDEITEMAEDITQDVLQLYDDLPEENIDRENGIANLGESKEVKMEVKNMNDIIDRLYSGDKVYFKDTTGYFAGINQYYVCEKSLDYPKDPNDYDEGYTSGWNIGDDTAYDKEQERKYQRAKKASEDGDVWEFNEVDENGEYVGVVATICYGKDELQYVLDEANLTPVNQVKKFTEKMGKDADKKYSNLYKYKGKAFAYDNENAIVEYVYVDPEDNSWIVLDEIGLSNDNWDNKEARDEYLDEYIAQLDDEANRLADDFIANEYLGESLASRYVKTENKSIKTEASEGTATLDANSDLLPIINMYQYDLYNMCDDLVPPPNADMSKDVDEAMLDIAEPIIEEEIKGVLPSAQITFKEYKHPQYYRAFSNLNDVLYFDITYNVAEYEALKEKAIKDPEFEQYLKDHYKSYDGFMSFFADNLTAFNQQEEWKQFVSVLSYYLPNDDEQNYNTLLSDTYDKLLEMGYEPVDSIVDGLVDNITDRANDGEMTLNKDTVTQYIKELYGDVDQYDYILDGVLNGLSLSESKKVTEVATATKSAGEYWVGDPCYVVPDDIYQGIWGDKYKFKDGTIDCGNGLSFQVHGTAWGDGEYKGSNGFIYGVDAGVLAIVPMELATKERGLDKGTRHKSSTAKLEYKDGVFNMIFDNETITIDTDPSEDLDESKQLKKEDYEVRQDYYDPETGEAVRNEYVMSFDTWEEAQRFADGLAQDPNCTAWVNDTSKDESKKIEDKELLTENDEIPVVNPDEQDYYNNKGYIISLYPRSRSNVSII